MGRGKAVLIRLVSEAGTGFFYTTQKNPMKTPHKLQFLKYDPARQPASTWGFFFAPRRDASLSKEPRRPLTRRVAPRSRPRFDASL